MKVYTNLVAVMSCSLILNPAGLCAGSESSSPCYGRYALYAAGVAALSAATWYGHQLYIRLRRRREYDRISDLQKNLLKNGYLSFSNVRKILSSRGLLFDERYCETDRHNVLLDDLFLYNYYQPTISDLDDAIQATNIWPVVINKKRADIARLLLERGANVEFKNRRNESLLSLASESGRTEIVRVLLEKGAQVDGNDDSIPLYYAARNGHTAIIQLLLDAGADMERTVNNLTALGWAMHKDHVDTVRLLVKRGACTAPMPEYLSRRQQESYKSIQQGTEAEVAWHHSELLGHNGPGNLPKDLVFEVLKMTNSEEAVNAIRFPLHWASKNGHAEVVQALLQRGIDIGAKNRANETAMYLAVFNRQMEVVRTLLENGAEIDSFDMGWETPPPLYVAMICKYGNIARLLIERGATLSTTYNFRANLEAIEKQRAQTVANVLSNKQKLTKPLVELTLDFAGNSRKAIAAIQYS